MTKGGKRLSRRILLLMVACIMAAMLVATPALAAHKNKADAICTMGSITKTHVSAHQEKKLEKKGFVCTG